MAPELVLTPTDFIAITNQILENAMPFVYIEGELANFKVNQNKWLFFDVKDAYSKIRCFGTIYSLPGPLQDGMVIKIGGQPKLHPQYGFSINVQSIQPVGEGSIKKAYELLKVKLQKEGMFDAERKRALPYPPRKISLITSKESAAYADFIKIVNGRWPYLKIELYDTQVQGENAPLQIMNAVEEANKQSELSDAVVVIRGGGSMDDLAAFNDERAVRAVAASRVPTLVAIGHEIDTLLSELAADVRASTPSNAAELLVPSRQSELENILRTSSYIKQLISTFFTEEVRMLETIKDNLINSLSSKLVNSAEQLTTYKKIINAYSPSQVLNRGYAIVRQSDRIITSATLIDSKGSAEIEMRDGGFEAGIKSVKINKE